MKLFLLCVAFVLFVFSSANDCSQYGFTENLMCTTCKKMGKYIEDKELMEKCLSCCIEEKQASKYVEGRLEVCS